VIAEEGDAEVGFGLAEEAQARLGVGGAIGGFCLPGGVGLEFGPGEGSGHGESYGLIWLGLMAGCVK
jgi:hypothetical protein